MKRFGLLFARTMEERSTKRRQLLKRKNKHAVNLCLNETKIEPCAAAASVSTLKSRSSILPTSIMGSVFNLSRIAADSVTDLLPFSGDETRKATDASCP